MKGRLQGKTLIITGAGRGIGRAYALAMAREGARVVVNDVSREQASQVAEEICREAGQAVADHTDISDFEAVGALMQRTDREGGGVHGLINNAATEFRGGIDDHTADDWDTVMAVNARGSFNCAHHAAKLMRKQGHGAIVNTTSGAFWDGTEGVAAYSASKAAVFSLTLSLDSEFSRYGITSNCIAPNVTRTRMLDSWIEQLSASSAHSDQAEEEILAEWGVQQPANLAPLAIVLCSDEGRSISGRIFEIWNDKIYVMRPPSRGEYVERSGDEWEFDSLAKALPALV
jgi:NAD(P)-dependent dehydrogenase (short-subunit alcohol dehydrogenase family)